jgi:hypothetical protein
MNQLPPVPALGLTLAIPREHVQQALDAEIAKGYEMIRAPVTSLEAIEQLKRQNWNWVLQACEILKQCFTGETVGMFFSSSVYVKPSVNLDDLGRELEEFPYLVRGRIDRLQSLLMMLPVIPQPPAGDFLHAQFHPRIYRATWRPYELGQHGQAIALAVQELEDVVKEATFGNLTETGADLMRKAFDPEEGPLQDKENTLIDKTGIRDLLVGFMQRYRSLPPTTVMDIAQTARILATASHLIYIVESCRLGTAPAEEEEKPAYEFELLKPE